MKKFTVWGNDPTARGKESTMIIKERYTKNGFIRITHVSEPTRWVMDLYTWREEEGTLQKVFQHAYELAHLAQEDYESIP